MKKILLIALACATVAGCKHPVSVPRPPGDKLTCDGEPGRPVGSGPVYTDSNGAERHEITDEDNSTYLRGLRAAGQSCRDDVNWLKDWFSRLP